MHRKIFDECFINQIRIESNVVYGGVSNTLQRLSALFANGSIFANDELVHFRLHVVYFGVFRLFHFDFDIVERLALLVTVVLTSQVFVVLAGIHFVVLARVDLVVLSWVDFIILTRIHFVILSRQDQFG